MRMKLIIFVIIQSFLTGRGGRTNHHPGNVRLREIVNKYRFSYNQAKKVDKPQVSRMIVSALRRANPPSRFLRYNEETKLWEDVGDKRAAEKVSQTLREKDEDEKKTKHANKQANTEMADSTEILPTPLPSPDKNQFTNPSPSTMEMSLETDSRYCIASTVRMQELWESQTEQDVLKISTV